MSRFIFNALQSMVYWPVISLELALKVMWIGRRYHVVLVYLINSDQYYNEDTIKKAIGLIIINPKIRN